MFLTRPKPPAGWVKGGEQLIVVYQAAHELTTPHSHRKHTLCSRLGRWLLPLQVEWVSQIVAKPLPLPPVTTAVTTATRYNRSANRKRPA
jgi:hypothetical protein